MTNNTATTINLVIERVVIERGRVWTLDELEVRTIALDGAVQGPHFDSMKQVYSFDHHAGCLRLITKATCEQVLDALLVGFNPKGFTVLVNDIDGDTVLAVWLLQNGFEALSPSVRNLVSVVGLIDAHGPAYKLTADQQIVADQFYQGVMKPERDVRFDRTYGKVDLELLLDKCLCNLQTYIDGYVFQVKPQDEKEGRCEVTHHDRKGSIKRFSMVKSNDYIFGQCYKVGVKALVLYSDNPDGSTTYTLGRESEFVPYFHVESICKALSAVEPGWGGSSTIGGAPRNPDGSRSHLSPDQVFAIIRDYLDTFEN